MSRPEGPASGISNCPPPVTDLLKRWPADSTANWAWPAKGSLLSWSASVSAVVRSPGTTPRRLSL